MNTVDPKPLLVLGVLLLAGCAADPEPPEAAPDCAALLPDTYEAVQTRGTSDHFPAALDPRQTQDLLFTTWGWPNPVTAVPWNGSAGPIRQSSTDVFANGTGGLVVARFAPFGGSGEVEFGPAWAFESAYAGACVFGMPLQYNLAWTQGEGDLAQVGQGVRVLTAGFWENGTLFYTNMQDVHDSDIPRAGWYAWGGAEPLDVYVYDQDRTERPAYWAAPSSQLSAVPSQGPPFDDAVAEARGTAAGAEGTAGVGYGTTIKGFNEALKGLSTTTNRVVHVAPEDAYTLPGNEAHALYGDAIVFLIRVVEVVPAPCPNTAPCGVPDEPF